MARPATGPRRGRSDLPPGAANHVPLSPLSFLARSADVYPDKVAVIHGDTCYTYAQFRARCRRLASALRRRGIHQGATVAIMPPWPMPCEPATRHKPLVTLRKYRTACLVHGVGALSRAR